MSKKADAAEAATTRALLDELKVTVDDIARATIREKGIYGCALRASVAKSFEFTSLAHQDPPPAHGFFITATLRGICEDLITFTFLEALSEDERNEAISLLMSANIAEGVDAQSKFFWSESPVAACSTTSKAKEDKCRAKATSIISKAWVDGQAILANSVAYGKDRQPACSVYLSVLRNVKVGSFQSANLATNGLGRRKRRCW